MDVAIKSFDVAMDVKNKGVELEIREPNNGSKLGNLVVTKGHLIWCAGKTQKTASKKAPAKKASAKRAAKKAARKVSAKSITPAIEPATE
jgi:hypothetical protein